MFMNMDDAQDLLDLDDSEVNAFYVYVDDEDNLKQVSSFIEEQYPDPCVFPFHLTSGFRANGLRLRGWRRSGSDKAMDIFKFVQQRLDLTERQ